MIDSDKILEENQEEYQPKVGMLLYLVKHSRLNVPMWPGNLANDGVNPAAFKELLHVIKYVFDKKNLVWSGKQLGKPTNQCK